MKPEELPAKFIFGQNNVRYLEAGAYEGSIVLTKELGGEALAQFTLTGEKQWAFEYPNKEGEMRKGTIFLLEKKWHIQLEPNQERRKLNCRTAASPFEMLTTVSTLILARTIK